MAKKPVTIEDIDTKLSSWRTRLKRAINKVDDLEKQRKRLVHKQAGLALMQPTVRPRGHVALADMAGTFGAAVREAAQDAGMIPNTTVVSVPVVAAMVANANEEADKTRPGLPLVGPRVISPVPDVDLDAIPGFLQRKKDGEMRDLEARVQIEVEQANKRIAKTRARLDNMKAKKAGDTKRMPLSGKAALDKIKNG